MSEGRTSKRRPLAKQTDRGVELEIVAEKRALKDYTKSTFTRDDIQRSGLAEGKHESECR